MPLYYLDPEREPRACPFCPDGYMRLQKMQPGGSFETILDKCSNCGGTGRLGVEGAEPDVEVLYIGDRAPAQRLFGFVGNMEPPQVGPGWFAGVERTKYVGGPHPTESAALKAARKAHRSYTCDDGKHSFDSTGRKCSTCGAEGR